MKKKKRKQQDKLSFAVLAFALSCLIYSMVWVEANGTLIRPSMSKRAKEVTTYVNSTSMSDSLYQDEVVYRLALEGTTFQKNLTDSKEFQPYRPSTYSAHRDTFSISKVQLLPEGSGLTVRNLTPTHFTHLTLEGFMNALSTSGATDAQIDILSPTETSGENALAGVFPYFVKSDADRVRMNLAQSEMGWLTYLQSYYYKDIQSPKRINQALAKTKLSIRNLFQLGRKNAIRKQLRTHWNYYDLPELSEKDEADLVDWLYNYQESTAVRDRESHKILEEMIKERDEA